MQTIYHYSLILLSKLAGYYVKLSGINVKKTKVMPINADEPEVRLSTLDRKPLEVDDDFIYLGA